MGPGARANSSVLDAIGCHGRDTLPECSCETDETSGMGLMQEERRLKGVGSGMGVDVGNRLDARKRRGQGCVGSGMSVGVGNRLDARKRKGRRSVRSGMH